MSVVPLGNALRLEIEGDPLPGTLVNLVRNPNGDLGGWGWVTPVAGSHMHGITGTDGRRYLSYYSGGAVAQYFYTEPLPVTGSQYVMASWLASAEDSNFAQYQTRFEWLDAAGAIVASTIPSSNTAVTPTRTVTSGPVLPSAFDPALIRHVRIRFDLVYAGPPPPGANALVLREVTVAAAATAAALASVRTNLVANPSVETNLTGWTLDVPLSAALRRITGTGGTGAYIVDAAVAADGSIAVNYGKPAVIAGLDYAWSIAARYKDAPRSIRLRIKWFGPSDALISTSLASAGTLTNTFVRYGMVATAPPGALTAQFAVLVDDAGEGEQHQFDAALAEQASTVGPYFDGATANTGGRTHAWTGTAHASTSTEALSLLAYIAPIRWINILGPTHDLTVTREQFNVSTLSAVIVDAALDPATSTVIKPGRLVRLIAYAESVASWQPVFTGRVSHAVVDYQLKQPAESKRARIELTAVDAAQTLANTGSPEGVAHIDELPYVLESVTPAVPWNCNGSGGQVGFVTVVSTSDSTTTMDQLALTRDTSLGYVWVDPAGTVQAWDRDQISAAPAIPLLDEYVYGDVTIGYDTDVLINEVSVSNTEYDAIDESNTVTVYGPFRDDASIDEWGVHRAEFATHGLFAEDMSAYAASILEANATPIVRISSMRLHVEVSADWAAVVSPHAFLDLYDLVEISCDRAGMVDEPARVASIRHTISGPDSKWLIELGFAGPESVSVPSSSGAGGAGSVISGGAGGTGGGPVGPAGGDLTGFYPNPTIGPLKVTTPSLADAAVTSAKILDATIALADLSATGTRNATTFLRGDNSWAVPAAGAPAGPAGGDLTGTYPNPDIGAGKVGTAEIADGAVTSAKILDGTIAAGDIAAGVIPSTLPGPPTGPAGGGLTGTYPNPTLATDSVGPNQITTDAVNTGELVNGAVTNPKLADGSVTSAKIADGTIAAADIAAGVIPVVPSTLPPSGAAGGSLTGTYPNPTLAANSVGASQITDGSITQLELADDSVGTAQIRNASITGVKIADGSLGTTDLADGAVTSAKILDGTIVAADLAPGVVPASLPPNGPAGGDLTGTYPNPTIGAGKVTSAAIADGTIVAADLSAALASSIAGAAVDGLVVHKAGAETITGSKTLDSPLVQTYLAAPPATPPAGKATGPYFGIDGLPYFMTPTGVAVPFNIGDPETALHLNPSFETFTGSVPNSWDNFWSVGGTLAAETVDVLFGTRSLTVTLAAVGGNNQLLLSSNFAVTPGDRIDVGAWARAVSGNPRLTLGILTAPSGTPGPFDGVSTEQTSDLITLGSTYAKYAKGFVVPAGHTVGKLQLRIGMADALGAVARLDATSSSRAGASSSVLPGNSWPKEAVRCATTGAFTPTTGAPSIVDGQTLAIGDRVLKATPVGSATDGIWTVVTPGSGINGVWARAADASTSAQLAGAKTAVKSGNTFGGTRWGTSFKSTDTLGSTVMSWLVEPNDSGWIGVPFNAGWVDYGGGFATCQYRRIGDLLYLKGLIKRTGANVAGSSTMFSLPAGFRPAQIVAAPVFCSPTGSGESIQNLTVIWDTGNVYVTPAMNTNAYCYLNIPPMAA